MNGVPQLHTDILAGAVQQRPGHGWTVHHCRRCCSRIHWEPVRWLFSVVGEQALHPILEALTLRTEYTGGFDATSAPRISTRFH